MKVRDLSDNWSEAAQELSGIHHGMEISFAYRHRLNLYYESLGDKLDRRRKRLAKIQNVIGGGVQVAAVSSQSHLGDNSADDSKASSTDSLPPSSVASGSSTHVHRAAGSKWLDWGKKMMESAGDKLYNMVDSDPELTRRSNAARLRDEISEVSHPVLSRLN